MISSTRMREGHSPERNSAKRGSIGDISRPFQAVKPGGGSRPVAPYHSTHEWRFVPTPAPVSASSASAYSV